MEVKGWKEASLPSLASTSFFFLGSMVGLARKVLMAGLAAM